MVRYCVIVWPKKANKRSFSVWLKYAPYNPNIAPEAVAAAPGGETGTAIDAVPEEGAHSRL